MKTLFAAFRKSLALIISRRNFASKSKERSPPHMNELPVPHIPWDEYNDNRQTFYNAHLLFGAFNLLAAIAIVLYTGSMYLNWGPPKYPGPPSDMVEECDDADAE